MSCPWAALGRGCSAPLVRLGLLRAAAPGFPWSLCSGSVIQCERRRELLVCGTDPQPRGAALAAGGCFLAWCADQPVPVAGIPLQGLDSVHG